jgi:hypothetical protein
LIHRDVEPVRGLAALARCVFEYEVFASRPSYDSLSHLDITSHAVLFVYDEVTRFEL